MNEGPDPLHYADIIKVNAFGLIRGLYLDMEHQIVVTTHDEQQASLVSRKFESAGLASKLVRSSASFRR
ncbi:hypothetical protein Sj15T_19050 [Sphingobium sp. TA15]|nr:hypothetical protein Sj15T_19050 [Sphingobium sp. TA15]